MTQLNLFDGWCQRWQDRAHSWRHKSEGGFNAALFDVQPIPETIARAYVQAHHYSGSYPAARLRYGLFEHAELVGVAVLTVPVRREVLTGPFPNLEPYTESLELGRLVLADQVPANAESWFLARVFDLAAREGIRGVVSFSDPQPRRTLAGTLVMPGHVGTIYQASNATYLGRGRARSLLVLPDATVLNDRALQKLKAGERGAEYVERLLASYGAPARAAGQSALAWLPIALDAIGLRRVAHQGNHRYAFVLGTARERRAVTLGLGHGPYPKQLDQEAA